MDTSARFTSSSVLTTGPSEVVIHWSPPLGTLKPKLQASRLPSDTCPIICLSLVKNLVEGLQITPHKRGSLPNRYVPSCRLPVAAEEALELC
jgi:hypothetical protein